VNVLVDALPDAVEIGGIEYPIETDFRAALRVILAFEDEDLTTAEKSLIMLANLYPEMPHDPREAMEQAIRFLNGPQADAGEQDGPGLRLYSFAKDAPLIYAAFRQTHGVDLETAELHWWKFLALFMDLGSETAFCQLVSLRKRVKTGKASKVERALAAEMGEAFKVPEPKTVDEKMRENEFLRLVEEGKRRRAN
jgi:hypothetical protein